MSSPGVTGRRSAAARLAGIGLLAGGVAAVLYVAGRLHTPNYAFGLFGRSGLDAIVLKSLLASIVLGLAALQVLLALWIYRKLPLAGSPPRPARLAHRVIGFGPFAPLARGLLLLRCLCREGAAGTDQAAAGLGTASCGGHARRRHRRALVHLVAVVLQRFPATGAVGAQRSHIRPRKPPARGGPHPGRQQLPGRPARAQGTPLPGRSGAAVRRCMCRTD